MLDTLNKLGVRRYRDGTVKKIENVQGDMMAIYTRVQPKSVNSNERSIFGIYQKTTEAQVVNTYDTEKKMLELEKKIYFIKDSIHGTLGKS